MTTLLRDSPGALALLALLALGLSACGPRVQMTAKVKPNVEEAAELRRVAVMGFRGPEAERVNAAFETMLVEHRYDDGPYFTVVDRRRTEDVMREHGRSLRGEVDPKTAVRFGKQIGAQGVYFGDVMTAAVTPRNYTSEESYCTRYNSSGKKCRQWGKRTVTCRERTATVTLMPRLVDVETGRVVYRAEHTAQSSDRTCGGDGGVPDHQLMEQAMGQAMELVRADVAPRTTQAWVQLMDTPTALAEADTGEFTRGLAFARGERMDRACQIWRDLNGRVNGADNALLFNVAVCEETEGDYAQALRILEEVDGRLAEPDRNVNSALTRVKATLAAE